MKNLTVNLKTLRQDYIARTQTYMDYLCDIRRYPVLSAEEEKELFKTITECTDKSQVKQAKDRIINCNQRFVVAIAKRYANDDNILDLINEGNLGLMEALDSFDVSKNVRFNGWAVWYIRRAIQQYHNTYSRLVRPTNLPLYAHKLPQAINYFFQKEHRHPTTEELADVLAEKYNIMIKHPQDLLDLTITEIDCGDVDDDDNTNGGKMLDFNSHSSHTNAYEEIIDHEHNAEVVKRLLNKLSKRERDVIKYSFGIDCERIYDMSEVARVIGVTLERTRQIRNGAIEKLKNYAKKYKQRV